MMFSSDWVVGLICYQLDWIKRCTMILRSHGHGNSLYQLITWEFLLKWYDLKTGHVKQSWSLLCKTSHSSCISLSCLETSASFTYIASWALPSQHKVCLVELKILKWFHISKISDILTLCLKNSHSLLVMKISALERPHLGKICFRECPMSASFWYTAAVSINKKNFYIYYWLTW